MIRVYYRPLLCKWQLIVGFCYSKLRQLGVLWINTLLATNLALSENWVKRFPAWSNESGWRVVTCMGVFKHVRTCCNLSRCSWFVWVKRRIIHSFLRQFLSLNYWCLLNHWKAWCDAANEENATRMSLPSPGSNLKFILI